jgi:hypothetical protein
MYDGSADCTVRRPHPDPRLRRLSGEGSGKSLYADFGSRIDDQIGLIVFPG